MYGIFTNIYPKNHPNVGKYTIHGAYGYSMFHHPVMSEFSQLPPANSPMPDICRTEVTKMISQLSPPRARATWAEVAGLPKMSETNEARSEWTPEIVISTICYIHMVYIYMCVIYIYIYGILKLSLGCSFSFRCLFDISKMQSWRAWRVMPFRWNPWELVIFLMDSNHQTTDSCQKRGWCHHHHHHHHRRKVSLYFLD